MSNDNFMKSVRLVEIMRKIEESEKQFLEKRLKYEKLLKEIKDKWTVISDPSKEANVANAENKDPEIKKYVLCSIYYLTYGGLQGRVG